MAYGKTQLVDIGIWRDEFVGNMGLCLLVCLFCGVPITSQGLVKSLCAILKEDFNFDGKKSCKKVFLGVFY